MRPLRIKSLTAARVLEEKLVRTTDSSRHQNLKHQFRFIRSAIIATAIAISLPFAPNAAHAAKVAGSPIVHTQDGAVRGVAEAHVRRFMGIPYAAPPVGNLRWEPPAPHKPWKNVLDASKPANSCAQMNFAGIRVRGSEDCLALNVYTPNPAGTGLPVMVWIHGGTFLVGSGSSYDGSKLAERGHIVVVTINYRLGPFGFLAQQSLSKADPHHVSGNYGLLDQQAALKWVKDNIAGFGGDPSKVTVAGESAGGISIGLQIVSPLAAGLFDRAILESGPFLHARTLEQAYARGDQLAAKLGCDKAADVAGCMRSKPTEQVLRAIPARPVSGALIWSPVMDGYVVPTQPAEALTAGHFNKVPVINGSNHDEGTLFLLFRPPLTAAQYEADARKRLGDKADEVLKAYPLSKYPSPLKAAAAIFGDSLFSCQVAGASHLLSAQVPVFEYEFNDLHPPAFEALSKLRPGFTMGAFHGSEIQYVLGSVDEKAASPAQKKLSDEMMDYWIRFISTGDPDGHSPAWEQYKAGQPRVISFAPGAITMESNFAQEHHCALWESVRISAAQHLAQH